MGISKVVAIDSAILLGLSFCFRKRIPPVCLVPAVHASLVGFLVSICSHPVVNHVGLFQKSKEGSFPWWSSVFFYPYMSILKGYVCTRRKLTDEPLFTLVADGIYVGGWPFLPTDVPPGDPAVVDCTCELPRSECIKKLPYLCIPTWDSRGPSVEDIKRAVQWASEKRRLNRPVFIHCAFGHGRSVTVTCALLLSLGVVKSWNEAYDTVKKSRPRIKMNRLQMNSLDGWIKRHA